MRATPIDDRFSLHTNGDIPTEGSVYTIAVKLDPTDEPFALTRVIRGGIASGPPTPHRVEVLQPEGGWLAVALYFRPGSRPGPRANRTPGLEYLEGGFSAALERAHALAKERADLEAWKVIDNRPEGGIH